MPTNIRFLWNPEAFRRVNEPADVAGCISSVIAINGLCNGSDEDVASIRRFVLLKLAEQGKTATVVGYLLGEGLIGGV